MISRLTRRLALLPLIVIATSLPPCRANTVFDQTNTALPNGELFQA